MLPQSNLVTFIATNDLEQAKYFYQTVLGLNLVSEDAWVLGFLVSGARLRVTKVDYYFAPRYTVLGWSVADIQAVVDELTQKEIPLERYEGLDQDEQGIWTAPDGARVVWFKDPDGNILSVTQFP